MTAALNLGNWLFLNLTTWHAEPGVLTSIYVFFAGTIGALAALQADLRRRRSPFGRLLRGNLLTIADTTSTAAAAGVSCALLMILMVFTHPASPGLLREICIGIIASSATFVFLWREGMLQTQFQRPRGVLFAEFTILVGLCGALQSVLFGSTHGEWTAVLRIFLSFAAIMLGCVVIARILPPFLKKGSEYHRILGHVQEQGESVHEEYTPPTLECANPRLWHMADSQSTELEVLEFLKALVTTIKPHMVVETGTFLGYGTIALAHGLKSNGFGRIITIEYDPLIVAKARERIQAAGLAEWVESRNESSTESVIDGEIDFLFSDSALAVREQEIRRFLPQISSRGVIAIHDASSHFKIVRDLALRMEGEGLLSVVLLPTPRGLVIAQKRENRS